MATQSSLEARLKGEKLPKLAGLLTQNEQLWEPLYACYQSLQACGMGIIANGELLDTLRRVKCFGVPLVRIDIRRKVPAILKRWAKLPATSVLATTKAGRKPTSRPS